MVFAFDSFINRYKRTSATVLRERINIQIFLFRKIIGKFDFPYHLKNTIVRYEKIGYNRDVLRQTACLVENPIKINSFAYLSDCTTVGRASD